MLRGLVLLSLLLVGCACDVSSPTPPPSPPPPVTFLDLKDGDCVAGASSSIGGPAAALQLVDCGTAGWDARVLKVLHDGTYNCPAGTNLYKAIPLDQPTYRSITICFKTSGGTGSASATRSQE